MQRMEDAEVLCAEALEHVCQSWEALIDDEQLEQVTEQLYTMEAEFNKLKNDLKKLLTVEKMTNVTDMKKLQHQIAKL